MGWILFVPSRLLSSRGLKCLLVSLASAGLLPSVAAGAPGPDLVINEVQSSNGGTLVDEDGQTPDWIEIYNRGTEAIDLEGYGLSDTADPRAWTFPKLLLPPGGRHLVLCSGENRADLPAYWETVIRDGDTWKYLIPGSEPPAAWSAPGFDDRTWAAGATGIGYGDGDDRTVVPAGTISVYARCAFQIQDAADVTDVLLDLDFDDGFAAFLNGVEIARENMADRGRPPAFNEVAGTATEPRLVTGGKLFPYADDRFRGLLRAGENVLAIQVHNASAGSSDLSLIPLLTLGMTRVPPGARGPADLVKPTLPGLHASFKIAAEGETITLASPDGAVLDSVDTGPLPPDVSLGRFPDGTDGFSLLVPATPGSPNQGPGFEGVGAPVNFSPAGGFYPGPLSVALSREGPAGSIFFTLDGSEPTAASSPYAGPISLSATTVVRARVLGAGLYPGTTATHTFVLGRRPALPVVSISTAPANFFSSETGIYVTGDSYDPNFPYFGSNFWEDWERPVHLELFEPDGTLGFSVDAGAKIFGGWSRGNPQRSLSFFARGRYGAGQISYRIFPEKNIKSFESFTLRNSGNDWQVTHFRDALMTSLVRDLGLDRLAYRPAAVFINGEYWGILNLREKTNEHYVAANHPGVTSDSVDLLELNGSVIHGDDDHYRALIALLEQNDVSDDGVYAQVGAMADLENFIDYQAAQIYYDNEDWPGNNIKFWRPRVEGGRWRWILFDTDFGFALWDPNKYLNNTLAFALAPNGPGWPNPPWSTLMLRRLVLNRSFVEDFVNRFSTHLNTIFAPAKVVARINAMEKAIEAEMPFQRARWGGTMAEWRAQVQALRDFANRRVPQVRNHLRSTFGLGSTAQLRLSLDSPIGGVIEVQGIPIREYPFAGIYYQGFPIRLVARPDPGFRFAAWTGIEPAGQASASIVLSASGLSVSARFELECVGGREAVMNEIGYNAPEANDPGDWIEIHNRRGEELDLTGWTLLDASDGHVFDFPSGTRIAPEGYLVLCSDKAAFDVLHPAMVNRMGDLGFSLGGNGETLVLADASGRTVDTVAYRDSAPWPEEPDGAGATLARRNPLLDGSYAPHWRASAGGGTPGARNEDVFIAVDAVACGTPRFGRGDCDGDGQITFVDPVRLLFANFAGVSVPCRAACDADGDGSTGGVTDVIHLLSYLFRSGPAPAAPYPGCGNLTLPADAALGCETPPEACR